MSIFLVCWFWCVNVVLWCAYLCAYRISVFVYWTNLRSIKCKKNNNIGIEEERNEWKKKNFFIFQRRVRAQHIFFSFENQETIERNNGRKILVGTREQEIIWNENKKRTHTFFLLITGQPQINTQTLWRRKKRQSYEKKRKKNLHKNRASFLFFSCILRRFFLSLRHLTATADWRPTNRFNPEESAQKKRKTRSN